MKFLNWFMSVVSQLVAWWTRPRNVGLRMMYLSVVALAGALSSGFLVQVQAGSEYSVFISTAEGTPAVILNAVTAVALFGFILGAVLAVHAHVQEARVTQVSRVLVAELRGLVDTSDRPLTKAVPATMRGRIEDCLVDVRAQLTGVPDVPAALEELGALAKQVQRARGDTAREHVSVVAGGVLLDDEGKVELMDWDRVEGRWKQLDQPDDGSRFQIEGLQDVAGPEVVLAVSASYLADLAGIAQTFPGLPLVHLARPNAKPNTLWSREGQAALAAQFLDTLAELHNRGVQTIHLVLAASASLVLRLGSLYDIKNHPKLRCYEWKRDQIPAYPWSVQMPTAVLKAAYMPTPAPVHPTDTVPA